MVEYEIRFPDGRVFQCTINRKRQRIQPPADVPDWTRLDSHKCSACPLDSAKHEYCPVALDVQDVVKSFRDIPSAVTVEAVVKTSERWYFKKLPVEAALQSLLGLINATSLCPVLSSFNALAQFHLPFASLEETFFRAVSYYLFKQYYRHREGGTPDLDLKGLYELYEEIRTVNQDFLERIKAGADADATLHAVAKFISLSSSVGYSLEEFLKEFKKTVDRERTSA